MEIETKIITIRYHYILIRVAKNSFLTDAKYCEGFGESSTLRLLVGVPVGIFVCESI